MYVMIYNNKFGIDIVIGWKFNLMFCVYKYINKVIFLVSY